MDVDTLISVFRSDVHDVATPPLWTDEEIVGYLDEAQTMFCRLATGISDSSSELAVVSYSAGDEFVAYDPRILRLRKVRRGDNYRDVTIRNFEDLSSGPLVSDYGVMVTPVLDNRTGDVRAVITNMEENKLRLVHIPETDGTLLLTVYRLPLERLVAGGTLEVDDKHHRHLLHWAKHLAYLKEDAETFDKTRAATHAQAFEAYCERVKDEIARREHKVRVVAYGGL